jgi:uncharacterized membrane-anchored protein YhcB (DUF1043 family)
MWWEYAIVFIVGLVIGAVAYRYLVHKRLQKSTDTSTLERELANYENEVHQHFMRTTELVQQMGDDYQHLVEHLRQGIHDLGKSTFENGSIVPHFLFAHQHHKNHSQHNDNTDMPKTYIDPKNKE